MQLYHLVFKVTTFHTVDIDDLRRNLSLQEEPEIRSNRNGAWQSRCAGAEPRAERRGRTPESPAEAVVKDGAEFAYVPFSLPKNLDRDRFPRICGRFRSRRVLDLIPFRLFEARCQEQAVP